MRLLKGTPCFVDQPSSKSAKHVELLTWVGRQSKVVSVSKQGRMGREKGRDKANQLGVSNTVKSTVAKYAPKQPSPTLWNYLEICSTHKIFNQSLLYTKYTTREWKEVYFGK